MKRLVSSAVLIPIAAVVSAYFLTDSLRAQRNSTALSALPSTVVSPADNPMTPEKVELGRLLFWDLRASGLEEQALLPIMTLEEMRGHEYSEQEIVPEVVNRLSSISEYRELFAAAFGGAEPVNSENLGKALAAFQRTLVANNSPFDRYMRGDTSAMNQLQIRGMREFERVGCVECHSGPMFSDFKLHVLGVGDNFKLPESDMGFEGTYAFRTPSLRNLAYTAPYMHSGVLSDLDDVLDFYDRGGRRRGRGRGRGNGSVNVNVDRDQLDPLFRRLDDVDDSEREIIAFLGTLNDDQFDRKIPDFVPSGLNPGGRID
jgi:cytochrome c peroxidase